MIMALKYQWEDMMHVMGLFKGNGRWGFNAEPILKSGWFVPGNGKALIKLRDPQGKVLIAASQNKGPLKVFKLKKTSIRLLCNRRM